MDEFANPPSKCCANSHVKKIMDVIAKHSVVYNHTDIVKELGSKISLVHVYFKNLEVVRYSTQENYSIMELIGKSSYIMIFTQYMLRST